MLHKENLAPHAKKIALTNQQSEAEQAKAKELGCDEYIIKATMIPSEVVATVRDVIARQA
jgi:DNA-binding NarL/FixJ family response regulator